MMPLPSLDIVVVSFNAREALRACLLSLEADTARGPRRVVVVDNASRDGSPDIVAGSAPHAHLIVLPDNIGFARANNIGIREGTGRFVLLLNSDTVTSPGQIDVMLETLNQAEQAAVLGPRLIGRDGRPELSYGPMLSPWNEIRQKVLGRLYEERVPLAETLVQYLVSRPRLVDWVSGACLLVRRADAEAVGLLDEQYFMYAEDVDFCAALRARGRQILFSPAAEILHVRGASRRAAPEETTRAYRRSQLAFYAKHHPRWHRALGWYLRAKGARLD